MKNANAMKPTKTRHNMMLLGLLIGIFILPFPGFSMKETEKFITKESPVTSSTTIQFINKLGAVKVETWDKNQVKIVTKIVIDGKEEDVQEIIQLLEKKDFIKSGNDISFDTRFYSLYSQTFPGGIKMVLLNGKTLRGITKLTCSYVLTVPKTNPMRIQQKYEPITMGDHPGDLLLELYESNLEAGNLSGGNRIEVKYGKATIGSTGQLSLKLYEADARINASADLDLTSKYSTLTLPEAKTLTIDSYEDNLSFSNHQAVKVLAKYSTVQLGDFSRGELTIYETALFTGTVGEMIIGAKYSKMELPVVNHLTFTESYENTMKSHSIGALSATSKYSEYTIDVLEKSMQFSSSYEDDIEILSIGRQFTGIQFTARYSDLSVTFEPGSMYGVDANLEYTDFNYSPSSFREIRFHKDGSRFEYKGIIKGADDTTSPLILLNMYEGDVSLK